MVRAAKIISRNNTAQCRNRRIHRAWRGRGSRIRDARNRKSPRDGTRRLSSPRLAPPRLALPRLASPRELTARLVIASRLRGADDDTLRGGKSPVDGRAERERERERGGEGDALHLSQGSLEIIRGAASAKGRGAGDGSMPDADRGRRVA